MSILLLGAGGQVGREVADRLAPGDKALTRSALDITQAAELAAMLDAQRPRVVINAAAYTAVDRAETEVAAAFAVNADGPGHLAAACAQRGIALLHLSTDYVFDGRATAPYRRADAVNPVSVYGRSKAEGERRIREVLPEHLILRVSWVFGLHGGNFVKTMLRLAETRDELRVVDDQFGGPTPAAAIAEALVALARRVIAGQSLPWGCFHYQGTPTVSWHAFAKTVFAEALRMGVLKRAPRLIPIRTTEYPTPAARPLSSRFDLSDTTAELGLQAPDWRTALHGLLPALKVTL